MDGASGSDGGNNNPMPFAGGGESTGAFFWLAATSPLALGKRLTSGLF
jgi:hypothetical protein